MFWCFLGAAVAGEVVVSLATPVVVVVDGEVAAVDASLVATASGLSGGSHRVVVRNMLGKKVTELVLDVGVDEQVRLTYASKTLKVAGRGALAPAPAPAPAPTPAPAPAPTAPVAAVAPAPPQPGAGSVAVRAGAGGANAGIAASTTPSSAVATGGVQVDGQQVAIVGVNANEHGAELGMTVVDPNTGERVQIGVSVHTGGVGMNVGGAAAAPAPAPPTPIAESDLVGLLRSLDDASFSSDRESIVRTAAAHHHFRIAQVVRLLEPIPMSSDKLTAVEILAPKVVDPANAHALNAAFSFSKDREAAQALFR